MHNRLDYKLIVSTLPQRQLILSQNRTIESELCWIITSLYHRRDTGVIFQDGAQNVDEPWMHVCLVYVHQERRTGAPELLPKTEGSPSQGTNMTYLVCES